MTTGQAVEEDPVIDPSLQSLAPIDRRNVNPHPTSEYDVLPLLSHLALTVVHLTYI